MNEATPFQRWQKIAIDQLTYALNLFLVLTIATLGYWFSLLRDEGFMPSATAKCFMLLSFLALAGSVICGFVCIVCRTWDFKGTAQRARDENDAPPRDELRGTWPSDMGVVLCALVWICSRCRPAGGDSLLNLRWPHYVGESETERDGRPLVLLPAARPPGALGVSRLDGKEDDIRRVLELGVSKTAIVRSTGVSRAISTAS